MTAVNIVCKSCGSAVSASDLNMEKLIARCVSCNRLFDFHDQLGSEEAPRAMSYRRAPVPMPESIVLVENDRALASTGPEMPYREGAAKSVVSFSLVRRWYTRKYIFMAFFCVAWDSFLVFWYASVLTHTRASGTLIAVLFPIAHVAVGIGISYSTLAGFLNRTTITVRNGTLSLLHGPLPWRGNRSLPLEEIDQLYCEQVVSSNSNDSSSSISYSVFARMKTGAALKLLSGLPEADQALFIEQAIETRVGIEDVPVGGELAR